MFLDAASGQVFIVQVAPLWRTLWKTLTTSFSVVFYTMETMCYIHCYLTETNTVMN